MLTLLIGTDWVSNRDKILEMVSADVASQKKGRILMVPELISHDTERRLCAVAGDTCSRFAEVLSFTQLAQRVADASGHAKQACLDNGGRIVAMASAARQMHNKLKAYASVQTHPEFLESLVDAVDEFKRCCISPADLMRASSQTEGSLAQKLEELALLLECYDSVCTRGRRDPRDQMAWLLEELESGNYAQEHAFYIDGFPDFTRQHMAILKYLIDASQNVTISLTCDKAGSKMLAFEKAGATALDLLEYAQQNAIRVDIIEVLPRYDDIYDIRKLLLQGDIKKKIASDYLSVYRTETVYQECTAVTESVLDIIQSGGRYRDINIVCSDLSLYSNTLESMFSRCSIPIYISGTEDILEKPIITTVLAAMDAALGGFEQQDVIRYTKSMLSPLALEMSDMIENYAIMWCISGNRWMKAWESHPKGLDADWNDHARDRLEELNCARKSVIEPLAHLRDSFSASTKVSQYVSALYDFFEEISLSGRLNQLATELIGCCDYQNAQILNQLWEILLAAMEQMYDVLGETAWDAETFVQLFRLLLTQYSVGTIPTVLDAVTVGPVSAMRCQQCRHLFVLGAVEGALPKYSGSVGVLTDQERQILQRLGVPLTGGAMDGLLAEFSEIYGVFCGADKTVSISCPAGQPSFVYRRLSELAIEQPQKSNTLGVALGNVEDAGAYLVRYGAESAAKELGIADIVSHVQNRLKHSIGYVSHDNIVKLYGDKLYLSASQVDKQADCRLMYFLKYGLRAKERKPITVDPAEFGTYVHAVLEETAKEINTMGGFRSVSLDDTLHVARKHSIAYADKRFSEIDSQRLAYLFQRNSKELELIVRELWQELQNSEFAPIGFEVGFGEGKEVPPIDVSGKNMLAQLRGFVDRVDLWVADDGKRYFRIVDYKTGKKDFDYCDIYNGYGLQMLLYLFALEQEGQALLGQSPIPAGVQYFPARVPVVTADGIMTDEEAETSREKLWKRKGLLLSQESVLMAMETTETPKRMSYSRKKDGSVSGDLADLKQFALLKTYVFALVGSMVDDISSGCVTPNPYTRGGSHNACSFCPYKAVCHMQTVEGRRDYKAITAQQFWDDIQKEMSSHG